MPSRGCGAGKRKQNKPTAEENVKMLRPADAEIESSSSWETETLTILAPEQNKTCNNKGNFVDFEQLISESIHLPKNCSSMAKFNSENLNFEKPEMIRCGGDSLVCHVPDQLKVK